MQIQKLSILHLKSVCFTSLFFGGAQLGSPRPSTNTNPALTTRGIGFIIDPFRPGAITNPSFNETYFSFELSFFCNSIFLF